MMPGGGHQLMLFDKIVYSRVIDSWIRERVLGKAQSWDAPLEPEERTYFEFLDRERANHASGEPEYRYSMLDRLLMRISNGTIERGVRYFTNADVSEQWRFTAELVSEIDYAAWNFLHDYLPSVNNRRPQMAVVGCGSGGAIAGLLDRYPELGDWDIVGVPTSTTRRSGSRKRFADTTGVDFIVGDARNADVLAESRFDLIYLHGVFDHCRAPPSARQRISRAEAGAALFWRHTRSQPVHLALFRHDWAAVRVRSAQAKPRLSAIPPPRRVKHHAPARRFRAAAPARPVDRPRHGRPRIQDRDESVPCQEIGGQSRPGRWDV